MAKKPRKLSDDLASDSIAASGGDELWHALTKTVTPLEGRPDAPKVKPRKMLGERFDDRPLAVDWHIGDSPDPTPRVDRKTRKRLGKGQQDVDRSVDLHGLTQDQAFRHLKSVIEGAIKRGDKTLLVVTGKGGARFSQSGDGTPIAQRTRADFDQFGGVLKRMVPIWLEGAELKPFIEAYGEAAKEHGGEGALYIILRRRMPGSRTNKTPRGDGNP